MLWRASFQPDIRYLLPVPETRPQGILVIGIFSLRALAELEIWRRLSTEAEISFTEGFWLTPEEATQLPLLLAPSRLSTAYIGQDREEWLAALAPMPTDRAFATTAATTIVGPCTEDAWELMLKRLKDPVSNAQSA